MWKLLSGIVLVVLLDVAFIWMVAVEPDAPEIARAIGPTAAVPVIHDQQLAEPIAIDDSTEPVGDDTFEVRDVRGSRSNRRSFVSVDRVAQPDSRVVAATAPVKLFQDTIIWIGRTQVPVKIEQREEAPVIAESKPDDAMSTSIAEPRAVARKRRSFESKAFSVIKKPYDWMKCAIEKLH
jgi:hypothetical protein